MATQPVAKQSRMQIPPKVAGMLLALGSLTFVASVGYAFWLRHHDVSQETADSPEITDASDKEVADKLNAEIKAEEEERDRVRSDNEERAARIKLINDKLLKLGVADTTAELAANGQDLKSMLASCQASIVSVIPTGSRPGTGVLYQVDNSTFVITCLPKSSQDKPAVIEFHKDPQNHDKSDIVKVSATSVYSDPSTSLCILKSNSADAFAQLKPLKPDNVASAASGDRIYTILAQLAPDGNISMTAFDGNLSTADRKAGSYKLLQVAIGVEQSLRGAPLINAGGKLVGVMIEPAAEIEHTSFALDAADLIGPLQLATVNSGTNANTATNAIPAQASNRPNVPATPAVAPAQTPPSAPPSVSQSKAAAAAFAAPYNLKETIAIDLPSAQPFDSNPNALFAGPDNLLIVWDEHHSQLTAYHPRSNVPVWQYKTGPQNYLARIHATDNVFIAAIQANHAGVELELKTGQVARNGLNSGSGANTSLYKVANYFLTPSNLFIDTANGTVLSNTDPGDHVLGMVGNRIYSQTSGFIYYCDASDTLSLLRQDQDCRAKLHNIGQEKDAEARRRIVKDFTDTTQKVRTNKTKVKVDLNYTMAPAPVFQIGDGEKFIHRRDLWEINSNGAKKLHALEEPLHTANGERWFQAYVELQKQQPIILSISPDSKFALTQFHVIDAVTFNIVAELPLPVRKAGILSDDDTIFAYDDARGCVYFLSISTLKGKR